MGDSWEDWEDEAEVPVPGAAVAEPDVKKFEGEDEEEEEPKWKATVPQSQKPKERLSKYDEARGLQEVDDEGPLDDPIAEKLRQQRLVEEADYKATMELFGKGMDLDGFLPKSAKDFEDLAKAVAAKYFMPHAKAGAAYKAGVKALMHAVTRPMSAGETKDIETAVAGIRSEKLKEEKLLAGGKKTLKKATLNVGRGGGSAGLEDYVYDDPLDDDFDFM